MANAFSQKLQRQLEACCFRNFGDFHAYLHAKNKLPYLILKILQRNSKLVTLGNLGMLVYTHLKL